MDNDAPPGHLGPSVANVASTSRRVSRFAELLPASPSKSLPLGNYY